MTTILVVDDNEQNLYQLQVLLGGHGYRVLSAADGAEALSMARQSPPDLIVSDILMPVMDGFSLCREWKKDERLKGIPFVFYTATYTDERDRDFALNLGAQRFIVKPEEPDTFIRLIREAIEEVQPSRSGTVLPPGGDLETEETGYLKQYNEALIRKLEAKMQELEQANRALEADIAARRLAEEALRESEERYRLLLTASLDAVLLTVPDGRILSANPAACQMFGCSEQQLQTLGRSAVVDPSDPRLGRAFEERERTGRFRGELTLIRSDGSKFPAEVSSAVFRTRAGETRTSIVIRDIADHARAQHDLETSETRYRRLFESAKDGILIVNAATGAIEEANPFVIDLLGVNRDELLQKRLWEIGPLKDTIASQKAFAELQDKGYVRYEDLPLQTADGRQVNVEFVSNVYPVDSTNVVQCNIRDITERAQGARELQESKQLIEAVVENVPLMIFLKEAQDLRFVVFNRAGEELLGYDRKDLLGKNDLDLFPPEQAAFFMAKDRVVLAGAGSLDIPEEPILTARKGQRLLHTRKVCIRGADGITKYLLGISEDITERKRAEDALRRLSARHEAILGAIPDIVMEVDANKVYTWANPAGIEFFGHDVIGREAATYFIGEQDTYLRTQPLFAGDTATFYVESWQRRKDGQARLLAWWCRAVEDVGGRVAGALSTARDITEHRLAEEALVRERDLLNKLITNIPDHIYFKDRLSRFTKINEAQARWFGLSDPRDAVGKADSDFFSSEHAQQAYADEQRVMSTGEPLVGLEEKETWPDGRVTWASTTKVPIQDARGDIVGLVGISRDITERRRVEEALRTSEVRFRGYFESTGAGCAITSPTAGWIEVNDRLCDILGYSREEIQQTTWTALTHPEDVEIDLAHFTRVLAGEIDGYSIDKRFIRKDGKSIWTTLSVRCVRFADGGVDYFVALLFDISERKQAEEAVRQQSEFLQRMIDAMPYPVFYKDRQGRYLGCNRAFEQFYGTTRDKVTGKTVYEVAAQQLAETYFKADEELFARPGTQTYEGAIQSADGIRHDVIFHKATFEGSDGRVAGLIGAVVDITDRKKAESALRDQLDELRRWHEATLGREGRVLELKKEVNDLLARAGEAPRYPSALGEE